MDRQGLEHVSGYMCTACDSIIKEVKVTSKLKALIEVEMFVEEDLYAGRFEHMFDELEFSCPLCDAILD
jgi:hypothetical protein